MQPLVEKQSDSREKVCQILSSLMQNNEVIGVADITRNLKLSFYEVIKYVHVDIDQQLACEVTKRKTDTRLAVRMKASDYFREEPESIRVVDVSSDDSKKNIVIDVRKKLSDVTFQYPDSLRVIVRNPTSECTQAIDRFVRAFVPSAGIRIKNKLAVEKWIQDPVDRMMQEAISNRGFMNVSWLRVVNLKSVISAVPISLVGKAMVQCDKIIHEMSREQGDIIALSFARQKLLPRGKQIFKRNDILIRTMEPRPNSLSLSLVPEAHRFSSASKRDIWFG